MKNEECRASGVINGHEYVDLGLSVKWATCNVGTSRPEGYGKYFAWGETHPKAEYPILTGSSLGKYRSNIAGNATYDAACANWGGTWRLPTAEEIDELVNNCQWTWTTLYGVNGVKVTGPNGNSIFLPAAGFRHGLRLTDAGERGLFCGATFFMNATCGLRFSCGNFGRCLYPCGIGLSVRPVSSSLFPDKEPVVSTPTGYVNSHGYVDLGLSVMWAICNVGASSPEEYGDHFAWGEITPKSEYTKENSVTYKMEIGNIVSNATYDAARANWGGVWRLPTKNEITEIVTKCLYERMTLNGVNGYKVIGPNGNSIFLPLAGMYDGSSLCGAGDHGLYWSATPFWSATSYSSRGPLCYAYGFLFRWNNYHRYEGMSVRPVFSSSAATKLDNPAPSHEEKGQLQKVPTVASAPTGYINHHGYVDLGLSVKWATYNVGATSPEEYGEYFAWGETRTKSTYTRGNGVTYRKVIGNIAGDPEYDAASANWGGTWRLPTKEEIDELVKCKPEWTTLNGVKGYKVTGPNGNSIFLPAAGYRNGSSLEYTGDDGFYWSATPYWDSTGRAFALHFYSYTHLFRWDWYGRYNGRSVRPVSE